MTTQYNIDKYVQGVNGFGLKYSDTIYSATLVGNADTTITVPSTAALGIQGSAQINKFLAVINSSSTSDTYMAVNATAAKPVGGTFAKVQGKLINPEGEGVLVNGGDVIHFLSAGTPSVTVAFYSMVE